MNASMPVQQVRAGHHSGTVVDTAGLFVIFSLAGVVAALIVACAITGIEPLAIDETCRVTAFAKRFVACLGTGWVAYVPSTCGVAMM